MKDFLIVILLIIYASGIIATGMATDRLSGARDAEWNTTGPRHLWQYPAAFLWPIWVPGTLIYKGLIRGWA